MPVMPTQAHGIPHPRRSLWKLPTAIALAFVTVLLVASHRTPDWHWPPAAFVVVGFLVFTLAFAFQWITRHTDNLAHRSAVGISLATGFGLLWGNFVQMADLHPAAALYFVVPLVGIAGATVARLRPLGMARALFVMTGVQVLALATVTLAIASRKTDLTSWTLPELRGCGGNAMNALLLLLAGVLFRKAAQAPPPPTPPPAQDTGKPRA